MSAQAALFGHFHQKSFNIETLVGPFLTTKSELGQTRHFDHAPITSGLPRQADNFSAARHVSNVPI